MRASTAASYRMHVRRHISPRLGSIRLQQLTVEDVNRFFAALLAEGLSPGSVRRVGATLHRSLRDARRSGRVQRNVAEDAERPKVENHELTIWTPTEVRTFLAFAAGQDEQLHALFGLLVGTGMRRGEAVGLRWSDVDLDAATVRVVRALISVDHEVIVSGPKTKRGRRSIALDAPTVALLRRQRVLQAKRRLAWDEGWNETDLLFDRGDGLALHPEAVSKAFRSLVVAAGVPAIRLHDLRHTRASILLASGANAKVISEQLGHSTVGFTLDRYSHWLPGIAEDAAERAGALLYGSG